MSKYSTGFRNNILRKVLPPNNRPIALVSREEGVSQQAIKNWIARVKDGTLDLMSGELDPDQRSVTEKLSLLLESRSIQEDKLGEWLRQNGLHTEHLSLWEQELRHKMSDQDKAVREENRKLKKENKNLHKELQRKEKALAEMAALMVLKKKADVLWGEDEVD